MRLFCFRPEILFLGKFETKKSQSFKLKIGVYSNMQNSVVKLNFSVLDQKCSFLENLFQKIKIINLALVTGPIRMCRIIWYFLLFCFRPEIPFFGQIYLKQSNCQLKLKFHTYNQFKNILRLFDVLPNFPFTTSETIDDYYL